MSILDNAQDDLNAARARLIEQSRAHADTAAHRARLTEIALKDQVTQAELAQARAEGERDRAEREAERLKLLLDEANAAVSERDAIVESWVDNSKAMKQLLLQFGRTEDGTPVRDLPQETRKEMFAEALRAVVAQRQAQAQQSSGASPSI